MVLVGLAAASDPNILLLADGDHAGVADPLAEQLRQMGFGEVRVAAPTDADFSLADHADALAVEPAWRGAVAAGFDRMVLLERAAVFAAGAGAVGSSDAAVVTLGLAADETEAEVWMLAPAPPLHGLPDVGDLPASASHLLAQTQRQAALVGGSVAPVARAYRLAWESVASGGDPLGQTSPLRALVLGDGPAPSREGAWLAACVLSSAISGRPCEGPATGFGPGVRDVLVALADAAVLDDPFTDGDLPWTRVLAGTAGDDLVLGTWPVADWAVLREELVAPTVRIGAPGPDGPRAGRLWIDGGSVTAAGLLVGARGGARLVHGALHADEVEVRAGGVLRMDAGLMTVNDRLHGVGDLDLRAGTLALRSRADRSIRMEDGALRLLGEVQVHGAVQVTDLVFEAESRMVASESVQVEGEVEVSALVAWLEAAGAFDPHSDWRRGAAYMLVSAPAIDVDLATLALPEGVEAYLDDEDDGVVLRLRWDRRVPNEPAAVPPPVAESGCGCSTTPDPWDLGRFGCAFFIGVALARRRRDAAT